MSTATIDRAYRRLLDETLPAAIHSEKEYERLLQSAANLMEKPEAELSPAEGKLLELLGMLLEDYETRMHPLPQTTPHKMLAYLLEDRRVKPSDLSHILPKSRASEILNGKRGSAKRRRNNSRSLLQFRSISFCRR